MIFKQKKNILTWRKEEIDKIVVKLKTLVEKNMENRIFDRAIKYLSCLSRLEFHVYYQYRDEDIEKYINQLSYLIFPKVARYEPDESCAVLIDSVSWDYHCLTQQYLRAMMSSNLNIMYIIVNDVKYDKKDYSNKQIMNELMEYNKATIINIPNKNYNNLLEQSELLFENIHKFRPYKIFVHSFSVLVSVVLNRFASSIKYKIDFGDHQYWAGIDIFDYIIGFRNWGLSLCNTRKKVNAEKLILLPYYPVLNDLGVFQGFPLNVDDKILIFSGGRQYKIIDKNQTFLKIMHRIIKENDNAIILFACMGSDELIKKYIKENKLENKILLIGPRKDLGQIMDKIHLYLNTYPVTGGLMTQYAAFKNVPILNFTNADDLDNATVEYRDFIDIGYSYRTGYVSIEEFHSETNKLVANSKYRLAVSRLMNQLVPSNEQFNKSFNNLIESNNTNYFYRKLEYDYDKIREHFMGVMLENGISGFVGILFRILSFKMFLLFPPKIILFGCFTYLYKKIKSVVKI
jgi:hypothetical protein